MAETKFNCKQEEFIPIMEQAWRSINRDKAQFTLFATKYTDIYLTNTGKAITDLKLLIHPNVMVAEGKEYTKTVNKMMEDLRPSLNAVESYVIKAGGSLTAAPSDFGFTPIREEISAHNKEGVVDKLEALLQLIIRNLEPIQAQGFTEVKKTQFETEVANLATFSIDRGQQIQDTAKNIRKYNKELKTLMAEVMSICKDGKIIFATTAPEKVKDYTFTQLLKLVRATANTTTPLPAN